VPISPLPGTKIVGLFVDLLDLTGFLLAGGGSDIGSNDERRDANESCNADPHGCRLWCSE